MEEKKNSENKARRDRPDRPRRSQNPHRKPKDTNGNIQEKKKEVDGNIQTPEKIVNGNRVEGKKPKPNYNKNKNFNGKNSNKNGHKKGGKRNKNSMGPLTTDIKEALKKNQIANEARMNPWKQIDISNKSKIRFTPLGGLGEIGGNIAVLEDEDTAIIIDVGMSFPDENMHGVDILVPDFSYLHAIKSKIKGIVITHAHEDHIGAVPYLFKELKFPIYGTPLVLSMIENKFNEHKLKEDVKYFNYITKREIYDIGTFKVEFMHMTHSIVDSCGLAIQTVAGTILHTADFKIDHTPIDNQTTDLQRFAYYGNKGVLCLFSDSTNSHNTGFTKSEAVVGKTFDTLFNLAKGRVLMSTFSSNTHRLFQAMDRGVKAGRKVCVIGRSMERNVEIARRLGFIDISDRHFIEAHEINRYADGEILIVTTGSQGEEMAALSRMATDEHRHIKLKPTDTVIISAHAIPGNEASVSALMNKLVKAGVTVRYKDFDNIHVSGHASQEEQKLILRLVQPKFFLPVHGEYNHIAKHAKTAISCGINKRNILLMSDGDQVEITTKYIKKVKSVKIGKSYIDNQNNREIKPEIVGDRQKLAEDGIVNIAIQINQSTKKVIGKAVITTYGLVPNKEIKRFSNEIENIIETFLINTKPEQLSSVKLLQDELRGIIRKHIIRTKRRYPIITPVIFLV
ncbi:Zn-dependent hydrolase, RNA-metabolising [hydrothermal vent metagenome]|uniref:Zn-dependent hydrolase, RNA-metabolising n=1 Tax=hydrothermal vent metagenome TaxID=652676 RepID=A0A1W1CKU5_9ZZZZ